MDTTDSVPSSAIGTTGQETEEAEAKEVEREAAKRRATRVSVSCQAALDEEVELEESAESSKTAAVEASKKVALEEATKRAALMKAVVERAAQGEASRIEAVAKRWGSAIEAGLRKAPQT